MMTFRHSLLALLPLFLLACTAAQTGMGEAPRISPPENVTSAGLELLGHPQTEVLLLGTFHFADAGLDTYRPEVDVDIFSAARQRELEDLLECLASFDPTVIAVEWPSSDQEGLDRRIENIRSGQRPLTAHEIDQIAVRLAQRLGLGRLHAVDVKGRWYQPEIDIDAYIKEHDQVELTDDGWNERYTRLYRFEDELKAKHTLRQHLLFANEPDRLRAKHGHYLVGWVKAGKGDEYPGIDGITAWYNRNLRIFGNIQRISRPGDRVLVLIGSGHVPILRHAVDASPDFALIEVSEVIGREHCP
jgi:hypothetical protein